MPAHAPSDPVRVLARRRAGDFIIQDKDYRSDFRQTWHDHPTASIDFVLRGGGAGVCGRDRIESVPGAVEYFPAQVRHNFASGPSGIRTVHVVMPAKTLTEAGVARDLPAQTLPADVFARGCLGAMRAAREPGDTGALDLQAAVHELIGLLAACRPPRGAPAHARRAAAVLADRSLDPVTLDELAAAVGVNRGHLARDFRRTHGCSPGEYQRRLRLRRAAGELARDRDQPIARVATACGFVDQAHMTNHFRRVFGVTPARYRAMLNAGAGV